MINYFFQEKIERNASDFIPINGGSFYAIALGLDDYVLREGGSSYFEQSRIRKLLIAYFNIFKDNAAEASKFMLPVDKFKYLREKLGAEVFLSTLTTVLATLSWHELCENPWDYRSAFFSEQACDPVRFMVDWFEHPNQSAIAACSKVLQLPMALYCAQDNASLPSMFTYNYNLESKSCEVVTLHIHGCREIATLLRKTYNIPKEMLCRNYVPIMPESAWQKVHAKLAAADEAVICRYEKFCARLIAHDADEVAYKDCYLQGVREYIGILPDTESMFNEIYKLRRKTIETILDDTILKSVLIKAIARQCALGVFSSALIESFTDVRRVPCWN